MAPEAVVNSLNSYERLKDRWANLPPSEYNGQMRDETFDDGTWIGMELGQDTVRPFRKWCRLQCNPLGDSIQPSVEFAFNEEGELYWLRLPVLEAQVGGVKIARMDTSVYEPDFFSNLEEVKKVEKALMDWADTLLTNRKYSSHPFSVIAPFVKSPEQTS